MTHDDRPLPTPPRSRSGQASREETGPAPGLLSDRMAQAAAAGRLEEFLQHEIPEGEHARNLTLMMMGMSGMLPSEMPSGPPQDAAPPDPAAAAPAAATAVPPGVLAAIEQGDVAGLAGILRAEHARRSGQPAAPDGVPAPPAPADAPSGAGRAGIDAAIIDELIRISADNDVSVDWLMLRAVKLYVEEHRKTGRL